MLIKRSRLPIKEIVLYGFIPSFLKIFLYRIKGYKIESNVKIGLGSVIIGKDVQIKKGTTIGFLTVIRAPQIHIDRFVKIGSFDFLDTGSIEIGEDTRINENVIIAGIRTLHSLFRIGKRGIIMEYSYLNPSKPLILGDDCGIGGHCLLFTHGSWLSQIDGFPVTFEPITIGNRVWLPWRVFILPGVMIGDDVVIAANSLVSQNIPSNSLAAGSPAKIISNNFPQKISTEKRASLIVNIVNDFISWMRFNNIEVKTSKPMDKFEYIELCGKKRIHYIIFNEKKEITIKDDSIFVIDKECNLDEYKDKYPCIVNLCTKERIGKSEVGEELISFLSRYGIRFNRLD